MTPAEKKRAYDREWMRVWRASNPAKVRANQAKASARRRERYRTDPEYRAKMLANAGKYRAANPDKVRARAQADYAKDRAKVIARSKKWTAAHPEKLRACSRAWQIANPERLRAAKRAWCAKNPEKYSEYARNRRARLNGNGGKHTVQDVKDQYKRQRGKCYWCKVKLAKKYHVDHVIPISKGGSNEKTNIVVACNYCNRSKGAKMPADFAGMLL